MDDPKELQYQQKSDAIELKRFTLAVKKRLKDSEGGMNYDEILAYLQTHFNGFYTSNIENISAYTSNELRDYIYDEDLIKKIIIGTPDQKYLLNR